MSEASIDPGITLLLGMTEEELEREAASGRIALDFENEIAVVDVTINCRGDLPPLDGVRVLDRIGNIVSARVALEAIPSLADRPEVLRVTPLRRASPLLHRSRRVIGATVVDGLRIRNPAEPWDGTGTTVGVIDSGFDLRHPAFREFPGGPTRVAFYWDRTITDPPRAGTGDTAHPLGGIFYDRAAINDHLLGPARNPPVLHPNALDFVGHGTHVAATAAGRGGPFRGIAPGASLILVRHSATDLGALHTICNWIFTQATGPCAINISLGGTGGSHDGTSDEEVGIDFLLRDPADQVARQGRSVVVAAGNDRVEGWHFRARALRASAPLVTQLLWLVVGGDDDVNELHLWYSGLDQIRFRLTTPDAGPGNRITHWVAPAAAATCVELASAGSFAPNVAGPAANLAFDFVGGTRAVFSQAEEPVNGDRRAIIRLEQTGAAPITPGIWLLEMEGANTLPRGGWVDGYLLLNDHGVPDTSFALPSLTTRSLTVVPGETASVVVFVPLGIARDFSAIFEYGEGQELEVQVEPFQDPTNPIPSGQFVAHGPAAIADAALTAPGAAVAGGLPFNLGARDVTIDHRTIAGRRRIVVAYTGGGPNPGFSRIIFRVPPAAVPPAGTARPVEVEARIVQDHHGFDAIPAFRDEVNQEVAVEVFPPACHEATARLVTSGDGAFQVISVVTVPGGGSVEARVRIPPEDGARESGGWSRTPWVAVGNVESADAGSLPAAGGAAGARVYVTGIIQVTIDYPAPAAGADGTIRVTIEDTNIDPLRAGEWRLEFRGHGITAPRVVRCRHLRVIDGLEIQDLEQQLDPRFDRHVGYVHEVERGGTSIPFFVPRETADEIRVEIVHPTPHGLRLRVRPPEPHVLPFAVTHGNSAAADPGAVAPAAGAGGIVGTLANGSVVNIEYPTAEIFPGHRRAVVSLRTPPGRQVFHPLGLWKLELESVDVEAQFSFTARISADGHTSRFFLGAQPTPDWESGTLRIPATTRDVVTVANALHSTAPLAGLNGESSPGPVRTATRMQVGGNARHWLPYPKPEITAPGTTIVSALSSTTTLWGNERIPAGWNAFALPDGRVHSMRDNWPLVEGGRASTQQVNPSAGGAVVEPFWRVIIPDDTATARLIVRYPAGRAFGVRVRQPGGAGAPANPRTTNPVLPNGTQVALGGAGNAAGTATPAHPHGSGQTFTMGDGTVVVIRQDGNGTARITIRRPRGLAAGEWRVLIRHTEAFPAAVPATVEADPFAEPLGWPKLAFTNPNGSLRFTAPRVGLEMTAAGVGPPVAPTIRAVLVVMPPRMVRNVVVRMTYPPPPAGPGAYDFQVAALRMPTPGAPAHPTDNQRTRSVTSNGVVLAGAGALPVAAAVAGGARFRFANGNDVTVQHVPGRVTVTFSRGNSALATILQGRWAIVIGNGSTVAPAAPLEVLVEMDPGPHDAPYFRMPPEQLAYAFGRHGYLAAGTQAEWVFRVPEARRDELVLDLLYDSRDTLRVQVQNPGGARSEPVGHGNVPAAGALGATLANTGVTAAGVGFRSPDRFLLLIDHANHPSAPGRNRVRITIRVDGGDPIPAGDWTLRLDPTAVVSNGVIEGWFDEMLHYAISGTSMAAPHITGLASLLFQQDHTQTSVDIKRRLLAAARPLAITNGSNPQLPNQWDPAAGFGMVDAASALLGHTGGPQHNRGSQPAAVGRTTGCPVACEDNCLLEGVLANGALVALRPRRDAPYNRAPVSPDATPLAECAKQAGYMSARTGPAFAGGGTFQTLASPRVDRPLLRDRTQRGGLEGFRAVTWEEAYRAVADRWVAQWGESGGVLVVEPRPRSGLIKELLFNRFSHQLHRLLGASTTVTKCSFTIKKSVSVASSRVPFGAASGGAVEHGLRELWNGTPAVLVGRGDLSLARYVVLWGANLPGNAPELWATLRSLVEARGRELQVLVVDPGQQDLPSFARRISILPGSDRDLALALMLRIVGNPAHAEAIRQIPEDPRFADAARGLLPMLTPLGANLTGFIAHVRAEAATHLRVDAGRVLPSLVADRCVGPAATPAALSRLASDLDALYEAYMTGPAATLIGDGPARHVEGEENVQYIASLAFLSGNIGRPGGGVAYPEDREATFNPQPFAGSHNTMRPEADRELGSEEDRERINLASVGPDSPDTTKIALWFDLDLLTGLPDAAAVEGLLQRTQLNVQVVGRLNDSSRYADIILPLGDSLVSYDLQLGPRSPWINLTQPIEAPGNDGPRPFARLAYELFAALRSKLVDEFEDDLKPVINEDLMKRGPLLLSNTRMQELSALFTDANRIPNLLRDRLPSDEVANVHTQLRNWYAGVHGGQPTADTAAQATFADPVRFFNRVQVDWIIEVLLARYTEREAVMVLYNLVQRGTVVDPARFGPTGLSILPDGQAAFAANVALSTGFADLKGAAGFAPERAPYRTAVRAVDGGATGRGVYPMRLVIAESPEYSSQAIPLTAQIEGGLIRLPTVFVNPDSPSLAGRFGGPLADGAEVAVVGNVSYVAGQRFETVIGRALVRTDATMARETLWMRPGWHGLGRGGQRVARGVHSEEGESPALSDNLVRLEPAGYTPTANAADRGAPPPKR
jgi:subtilisin family serine protease